MSREAKPEDVERSEVEEVDDFVEVDDLEAADGADGADGAEEADGAEGVDRAERPGDPAAVDGPDALTAPDEQPTISLVPLSDGGPVVIDRPIAEFEARPAPVQPYRPDTVVDGWSTDQITVRGASVRGYAHRYKGVTRQDDLAVAVDEASGRVVIAVADGVSSAEKSHVGSTLVCRFVVDRLLRQPAGEPIDWPHLVESAAWALVEYGTANLGANDAAEVERILATTLVAAVVSVPPLVSAVQPVGGAVADGDDYDDSVDDVDDGDRADDRDDIAGADPGRVNSNRGRENGDGDTDEPARGGGLLHVELVQVGDSSAWVLGAEGYERLVGGKDGSDDDEAVLSSLVSGLPRLPPEIEPIEVTLGPGEVLLLGTDGFGDPLGKGTGLVGELFADHLLGEEGPPSPLRFAHLLDFSRETFDDDRTLVAVWPRPWITSPAPSSRRS